MVRLKAATVILFSTVLSIGCSGGGGNDAEEPFTAPGLATGSVSATFSQSSGTDIADAVSVPALAAALPGPLQDDFDASRFLHRASFGPKAGEIEALKEIGYARWLAQQLETPATFLLPVTTQRSEPRWREHVNSWFKITTNAPDQLRQRVGFALSQFFVVSDADGLGDEQAAMANYYDILLAHSFGNFRDLLEQVTLSPIMGDYLSMKGNQKPDLENNIRPDENYAREVLQLFSIGLVQLNPDGSVVTDESGKSIPTYDQTVVEGFAHVFTGWHFKDVDHWNYPKNQDWFSPMQAYDEYHDKGEKKLLNGLLLAAGQSAEQDMQQALDNVFNHPNVGPFVVSHLIRQLVTSNPSPAYIERVVSVFNRDASGERGNLAAVVAAILLDEEGLTGHKANPDTFGKLREPLIRVVSAWRAFDGNPDHPDFEYGYIEDRLLQAPLRSPTVFNFFSADYSAAGPIRDRGLVSPEFQIHNESSIVSITNTLLRHTIWRNIQSDASPADAPIDLAKLIELDGNRPALFDYLSKLTLTGPASSGLLAQSNYLLDERKRADSPSRMKELLFIFLSSPEAAIQR